MNVFLIGDSIRYGATANPDYLTANTPGYGIYVKEMLEGKANVYAPDENCRFVEYTLRYLYDWVKDIDGEKIDVVHWNNGLWDVLRINGDEPLTPIPIYTYFLKRVYGMLKKIFPNARIIFALSTSVVEELADPSFCRYNSDIEKYNEEARKVMTELGVEINDLYAITSKLDNSMHCDWVHFNEEGSKILASAVVNKILNK